jgi:hypothetical protein
VVGLPPPGMVLEVVVLLRKWNYSSWLVHLFTWVWSPWNHGVPVGTLCGSLCAVVLFGLDLVRTLHHQAGLGRWWGRSLVPNGTSSSWSFPLGSGVTAGTILVPVGSLCVVLCAVVFFGAGSGGRTLHHLERSWVVEVLLYQMELPHGWSTFSLGSGVTGTILVPVGSLCGFLCSEVFFGAGSGGRTHCGTVLEGGGGPKWNYSLMVGQPFHLGLESTGTMW